MSKTNRDKWNHKIKASYDLLTVEECLYSLRDTSVRLEYNRFWKTVPYQYNTHYNKNPSWYNSLISHRPKRRQTRDLIRRVYVTPIDELDSLLWPLSRYPKHWWW